MLTKLIVHTFGKNLGRMRLMNDEGKGDKNGLCIAVRLLDDSRLSTLLPGRLASSHCSTCI